MTPYQELISKSRYSRYLPGQNRREDWMDTAFRWVEFFQDHFKDRLAKDDMVWQQLFGYILDLKALPSMRTIMTAGEALRRTHVAAYNCSYLPVDNQRSFDEAMYILLCGTGVGFSVEDKYVKQLPVIPKKLRKVRFYEHPIVLVVDDSKEGWCYAYKDLISHLYNGRIPTWDVSQVRPAGAPLKTFGGRASGPEPLVALFEYTVNKFKKAKGRKLKPVEAHDIMCKIGEVVVVGGVRRSAMISLGDLKDQDHATAKFGAWWKDAPERALANNSAVYEEKPDMATFMQEWTNIHASGSGERGIFNREASKRQAAKNRRRSYNIEYGTNP